MKIQDNISRLIMVGLLTLGGCAKNSGSPEEPISNDSGEEISAENGESGSEQTEMAPPPDSSALSTSGNSVAADQVESTHVEQVEELAPSGLNAAQNTSVSTSASEAPIQEVGSIVSEGKGDAEDTQFGNYIVQVNETLSTISKKIYGTTSKWQDLARLNSLANPSLIYPGDELKFEVTGSSAMRFIEKFRTRSFSKVTVRKGDTLAHIAGRVLGDQKLWKVLYADNRTAMNDPDKIAPGQVLQFWPESKFHSQKISTKEKQPSEGTSAVANKNRIPYAPIRENTTAPEIVQPVVERSNAAAPESPEPAAVTETSASKEMVPVSEEVGANQGPSKAVEAQSVPAADRDGSEDAEKIMEEIEKELESDD